MSGKAALPVRRDQAEGIPALRAPGIGDAVPLEHGVADAAFLHFTLATASLMACTKMSVIIPTMAMLAIACAAEVAAAGARVVLIGHGYRASAREARVDAQVGARGERVRGIQAQAQTRVVPKPVEERADLLEA